MFRRVCLDLDFYASAARLAGGHIVFSTRPFVRLLPRPVSPLANCENDILNTNELLLISRQMHEMVNSDDPGSKFKPSRSLNAVISNYYIRSDQTIRI